MEKPRKLAKNFVPVRFRAEFGSLKIIYGVARAVRRLRGVSEQEKKEQRADPEDVRVSADRRNVSLPLLEGGKARGVRMPVRRALLPDRHERVKIEQLDHSRSAAHDKHVVRFHVEIEIPPGVDPSDRLGRALCKAGRLFDRRYRITGERFPLQIDRYGVQRVVRLVEVDEIGRDVRQAARGKQLVRDLKGGAKPAQTRLEFPPRPLSVRFDLNAMSPKTDLRARPSPLPARTSPA